MNSDQDPRLFIVGGISGIVGTLCYVLAITVSLGQIGTFIFAMAWPILSIIFGSIRNLKKTALVRFRVHLVTKSNGGVIEIALSPVNGFISWYVFSRPLAAYFFCCGTCYGTNWVQRPSGIPD